MTVYDILLDFGVARANNDVFKIEHCALELSVATTKF